MADDIDRIQERDAVLVDAELQRIAASRPKLPAGFDGRCTAYWPDGLRCDDRVEPERITLGSSVCAECAHRAARLNKFYRHSHV